MVCDVETGVYRLHDGVELFGFANYLSLRLARRPIRAYGAAASR